MFRFPSRGLPARLAAALTRAVDCLLACVKLVCFSHLDGSALSESERLSRLQLLPIESGNKIIIQLAARVFFIAAATTAAATATATAL